MAGLAITYLLEDMALFGGVKVVLQQAELMRRRGHRVILLTRGPLPTWTGVHATVRVVASFDPDAIPPSDVVVATYWTTLAAAHACRSPALHYCQGIESDHLHNADQHPAIDAAYRLPVPAMVVSPHLKAVLANRFGRPAQVVPPALDPLFSPRPRLGPGRPPRVLITAPVEITWKGARQALAAVSAMRLAGVPVRIQRIAQWPPGPEEPALQPGDRFDVHLTPAQVAERMRTCDLHIAPSWSQEAFGLPVLESMASGVPVIASDAPCFEYARGAALQVDPMDVQALTDAAIGVLKSRTRWHWMRRRGLRAANRFRGRRVAALAERALRWAASEPHGKPTAITSLAS